MTARRQDGKTAGLGFLAFLILAAACSSLSGDSDTPIILEIRAPTPVGGGNPPVEIGDTFQLNARALNQDGDSIAATLTWRTPDTGLIFVEPATGRIAGKKIGIGRVQVSSGNLTSDLVPFSVVPAAESLLLIPPDSVRVLVTDTASAPLVSQLDTLNPDGPLASRVITYEITTIFGVAGDTASLTGGNMIRSVSTSALGQPSTPVYVRPIPSLPRPDSLLVEIRALRPSGAAIPGSGQTFIVRFD
jgi:hypothetical protein